MTLKDSFCPSPWIHMRINNAGHYEYCRWVDNGDRYTGPHISETNPAEYFQNHMQSVRQQFLSGEMPAGCNGCAKMEQHGKISGRLRQLLKVGARLEYFEKSLASSPWADTFSNTNFTQLPQDWQIDLGNYCNSACIMCNPGSSSRIASEWKKIGFVKDTPGANWTDDPELINKFVATLKQSPHIQYLHFIGGETVITPAFKIILESLIQTGLNKTATIGFTTNLISWDDSVVELLTQFQGVNLGMSVEAFDAVNDYVRWPSTTSEVTSTFYKWLAIAKEHNWLVQFRTTPTVLTVSKLLTVYDLAWEHNIAVESCNFLNKPEIMQIRAQADATRAELDSV